MMTLEELWENLRQDPEIKATMEDAEKSYKLFKKIENLIVADLEAKLSESEKTEDGAFWFEKWQHKKRDYDSVYKAYIENCKEIDQLKQQLQEEKNRSKKLNHEAQKYYKDAYCNGSQNQIAIAELQKVIQCLYDLQAPISIIDQIDQQIAELKGEK